MLGSTAREDKCRNCAGDGSTCKTIMGSLEMKDLQVGEFLLLDRMRLFRILSHKMINFFLSLNEGYNDILLIPASATNIQIKEKAPSNNYLAIRNASNHYYLNGNWRIDFPRPLTFADAIWHYDRRPQGFAAPDHISCVGPISENVYLVLLYQDRNVGIDYEYRYKNGHLIGYI